MKNILIISLITVFLTTSPALSLEKTLMMDRPEELLELAEKLAINIQSAEKTRDEILKEINKRSERLNRIDEQLHNTGLSKGDRLELKAQKNRLEREENGYRRQALGVVKTQMDNVFWSLEDMREKMIDLRSQEAMVDPEVVKTFNNYFRVSGELLKNGMRGIDGTDTKTFYMIETLENLGLMDDVERASAGRHERAGKGKRRGRRFRTPKSLLIIVEDVERVRRFVRNLPGVEVVSPSQLSVERLAPGGDPGRLTVFSVQALESIMRW